MMERSNSIKYKKYCVRLEGLVWSATEEDIKNFLHDCNITSIEMMKMEDGRPLGEAHVDLDSCEDVDKALKHHKEYLGERFVNIEALEVAGVIDITGDSVDDNDIRYVKLSNVPQGATEEEIDRFLRSKGCEPIGITITRRKQNGRISGVVAELPNEQSVVKALVCQNSFLLGSPLNVERA